MRIKLFGAEHPDVVRVLHTLGDCLVDLGRADEAIVPLERVVQLAESKSPKSNERVSRAMARYAVARALWDGGGSHDRATQQVRAAQPWAGNRPPARSPSVRGDS